MKNEKRFIRLEEWNLDNSITSKVPCGSCEHRSDLPKTCRSECEDWKKFEELKSEVYKVRREMAMKVADANYLGESRHERYIQAEMRRKRAKRKNVNR